MKLRDLIRKVRQCKTAAEERAVIAKESAMIRTAIREEQVHFRHRNVAKLLFMHMLGYPTHFGQLECMKLTASPHFPEKRIGYLGMLLLLSEEAEVLMLATNALKSDLTSDNKFVAGLALVAIGNLATADMSRDLAPEVDKHLKSPLSYLRKKACLAMARCLNKCPDMVEDFVERVSSLLKDKSHGVLITVVQLMTQVLMIDYQNALEEDEDPFDTDCRKAFLRLVPYLCKMLRNLLGGGYSGDHDVGGISDPFLQVQLLTLLRLLGTNNEQASEEMNDVLAQVATNTETSKNAGNAILYECVQTIMGVESEDGLRVLAVNILGRFLLNRDNNIRYVALNTLAKCIVEQKQNERDSGLVAVDTGADANNAMSALQRHRTTVVDCLKDPDVSIRQRALELIYHLVNQDNVEQLAAELLNYLVLCPREHRSDICSRILKVVDRFSPDDRWRVDTLITTLTIAGREASAAVQSATTVYISRAPADIHAFATHKLLKAIRDDDGTQTGLLSVGIWCIGEFGDLLLQPYTYTPSSGASNGGITSITFMQLDPSSIVNTIELVTQRRSCPSHVKERALTAYAKLSNRFEGKGDAAALTRLETLLQTQSSSKSLELQLRACEYNALVSASKGMKLPPIKKPEVAKDPTEIDLFGDTSAVVPESDNGAVSSAVIAAAKEALARMPVVDAKVLQKRMSTGDFPDGADGSAAAAPALKAAAATNGSAPSAGGDLLDIFGGDAVPTTNGGTTAATTTTDSKPGSSDMDLLAGLFDTPAPAPSTDLAGAAPLAPTTVDMFAPAPTTSNPAPAPPTPGMDIFGADPTPAAPAPAPINPMDLYATPAAPAMPAAGGVGMDIFGAPAPPATMTAATPPPAATPAPAMDIFGAAPAPPPATPAEPETVRVPAITKDGLSVEFECSKPDNWNKQKSTLLAHFTNNTGDIVYGMNLQVATPKFVTMEMEPASSTTIPVGSGKVTQKVNVVNSQLGTKNLVLKLKIGFTSRGQKIEHMGTCNGFPAGTY